MKDFLNYLRKIKESTKSPDTTKAAKMYRKIEEVEQYSNITPEAAKALKSVFNIDFHKPETWTKSQRELIGSMNKRSPMRQEPKGNK